MTTFIQMMALLVWTLLTFLTLYVLFRTGPDFLTLLSLLVVAVFGVGVFGAIGGRRRGPPL